MQSVEELRAYKAQHYRDNRALYLARAAAWSATHPDRCWEARQKWVRENPEKNRKSKQDWESRNPEKLKTIRRKTRVRCRLKTNVRGRERMRTDPDFYVLKLLRRRINKALAGSQKAARAVDLLGMEIPEYRIYLQGQFRDGMTWENRGKVWHIDHIQPCVDFDLRDPEQQKICFNWSNTQPLLTRENLSKGDK